VQKEFIFGYLINLEYQIHHYRFWFIFWNIRCFCTY